MTHDMMLVHCLIWTTYLNSKTTLVGSKASLYVVGHCIWSMKVVCDNQEVESTFKTYILSYTICHLWYVHPHDGFPWIILNQFNCLIIKKLIEMKRKIISALQYYKQFRYKNALFYFFMISYNSCQSFIQI